MPSYLIGGIEGGATHSHAIIMNSEGIIVGDAKGAGTNHQLLGMERCWERIADLINQSKSKAGIPLTTPLHGLGLSLSGCEQEKSNQELARGLQQRYPNLSEKVIVASDTEGSVAATSNKGGVTCIAGTGSNTLLINPDGTKVQCGGWGNLLGDEGSAWKISHRAVKYCFDDLDNFEKPPYPSERVWALVKSHFHISTQADILASFYQNFDKAHIAHLAKGLSELAKEGDALAKEIFREAGSDLARGISAVASKAANELIQQEGGLHVLCVGSVWLSWELLRPGFISWLRDNTDIQQLSLMRLETEMGVGATYLASDRLGLPLERDYSKNYRVFFKYQRGACSANGTS
ncbi:unnamed protein product [Phaedon cochleariae]|uniref:N-acetyl-D-glucosamine kinase n=1 Tax=Phaedon cochleariae TaxID=80249 RepID=A0A9P0DJL3_PHACE|nr:unnamed protein product [Phaedon cochleariae]